MKISVILTAYNSAPYLREALDSILSQEHMDWEAICVDDGSPDESGAILDEYAARDPRIRVVHQENKGPSASLNVGVGLTTGDYITFCDADDMLSPHWFSNAVAMIKDASPDLLRARWVFSRQVPVDFSTRKSSRITQTLLGQKDCLCWAWNVFFVEGFAWVNFIKADLKPFVRFPLGGVLKEDSLMLVNLAPHLGKIVQSDFRGYFYRNTPGSLLRSKRLSHRTTSDLKLLVEIWDRQRELALQLGVLQRLRAALQKFSDNDVIDWAVDSADEPREAKRQIRQAWIALRDAGAFDGRYHNRALFYLPFQWWKLTGNESLIKRTWKLFLFARKMLLRK